MPARVATFNWSMATDDELNEFLRATNTVHIVTTTRDGRTISTPIWAVDVDGVGYVRSAYGPDSKWYRRARTNPGAGFETPVGVRAVELEPIDAADPLEGRVDDALREKYASEPASVAEMLTPLAHGTTLRVAPLGRPL
jgi:hypothetical protein